MDYNGIINEINTLCEKYGFLSVNGIGESILGRTIPLVSLGIGKKQVVYIGAQSGRDCFVSEVLLRFVKEYCGAYRSKSSVCGVPIEYLYKKVTFSVLPMLNPDGVEYFLHGLSEDNPLVERVLKMNNGSRDFSSWCANARGVDLRHNYNGGYYKYKNEMMSKGIYSGAPSGYCGENSHSEPETGALSNYLRYSSDIATVIEFSVDKKDIWVSDKLKSNKAIGAIAQISGRAIKEIVGNGELCAWCADELGLPCIKVGCTEPAGRSDSFSAYAELRRLLFCSPNLFE